jgi:transketolase
MCTIARKQSCCPEGETKMNNGPAIIQTDIEKLCINTIRTLAMDAVQKADSGHPGAPMGLAPAAYVLWTNILKHNPENPCWYDRDRFILSGGHASMLLYSLLYLTGYDLELEDLKNFRQWESRTPGHPEFGCTTGVETTTGPLGQGFTNAVGMALAERHLAAMFNKPGYEIVDHYTYVMCGDGDMMEGITSEAASFAGHLGLSRLICIYDDNGITIEGKTSISFTEDVAMRFRAYNWHVLKVDDGNDTEAIYRAIIEARNEKERPSLIAVKTHIACGSPNKQDSADAHGAPLGVEEVRLTKRALGWPEDKSFFVPQDALAIFRRSVEKGKDSEAQWSKTFDAYQKNFPELAEQLIAAMKGELEKGWDADLPSLQEEALATRAASGKVLNILAKKIHGLIGGSADLAPSNNTIIKDSGDLQKGSYEGRNIRFGVREHAMGGIMSGIALHGGLIPFGGTFLVFADYMRPSIRLAALMGLHVIYVFTHDSIAVGEDGPTHQPVEHLACLRAIMGLTVIRPSDATETVEAWRQALKITDGPTALILSRQKLPVIDRKKYGSVEGLASGGYILRDSKKKPNIILIATGSEVHITLDAADKLLENGVNARVVSMPCVELFEKQSLEYRERVLPSGKIPRLIVEAGHTMGWDRYLGEKGAIIGMTRFGASAPGGALMKKFGFTAENIVQKAMGLVKRV